jgi:SAM-dependent methyltransferase
MAPLRDRLPMAGFRSGGNSASDDGSSNVFVASTKEAMDSSWLVESLRLVEERLENKVGLVPWTSAFDPGDMTAEALVAHAKTMGAAVVVLTGDDATESRGEGYCSPRDNLIFEAGIFISQLGLGRVLLLSEQAAKMPSDLLGVTLKLFKGPDESGQMTDVKMRSLANAISEFIERAVRETELVEDNAVTRAVKTTLERAESSIEQVRDVIAGRSFPAEGVKLPDPTNAYLDGVKEVRESFMTTTYLDSKFWTLKEIEAVEANQYLIERLEEGGSARRLIVLNGSIDRELKFQRDQRRSIRSKQPTTVEQMDREFAAFYNDNSKLVEEGFEVKVVFDENAAYEALPDEMNFKVGEDELALFDDERIDIYSGFTKKRGLPSARMFTDVTGGFEWIQARTCDYFNALWNSEQAVDFLDFGKDLNGIIEDCKYEIDYEKNWLLRYDRDADEGDARLKSEEMEWVLGVLGTRTMVDGIRHLDLGTCTGRYIRALREQFDIRLSVGVDVDQDCLDHCQDLVGGFPGAAPIKILDADIRKDDELPRERFDVITCMMGTLCHLRRATASDGLYDDPWQAGLRNLATRLADSGDAFVGVWDVDDEDDASAGPLLSIYPDRSSEILLHQSPPREEFERRLRQAELRWVNHKIVRRRLHVFQIQNA